MSNSNSNVSTNNSGGGGGEKANVTFGQFWKNVDDILGGNII
jgi:hypothetical protein